MKIEKNNIRSSVIIGAFFLLILANACSSKSEKNVAGIENQSNSTSEISEAQKPAPSALFEAAIKDLETLRFYAVRINGRKNHYNCKKYLLKDGTFAYGSPEGIWKVHVDKNFDGEVVKRDDKFAYIQIEDVQVWEAVVKSDTMINGFYYDLKITEMQFESAQEAQQAEPKINAFSKQVFRNPKHIHSYEIVDNRIFMFQTRAAVFKDAYLAAKALFLKSTGSQK